MVYKVRINSQVTIFEEEVVSVKANSPEEAKEMAQEAFREILDERFGWADIDTINTDIIKEG